MSNRALGQFGEDRAADWYLTAGYEVLARNWRCRYGEADLVCRLGRVLVICEVKTRTSDRFGSPAEAVTRERQGRLRRTAGHYLSTIGCGPGAVIVRFDVAEVIGATVNVIEAAF